ncbi:MAG: DUF4974 domain-containing protein [Bacteroidales bacterium]|nr:DUF4974 domain-containing protein [Bacteroidales bacterium]
MQDSFNKEVFRSMPNSVYEGGLPQYGRNVKVQILRIAAAAVIVVLGCSTAVLSLRLNRLSAHDATAEMEPAAQSSIEYTINNSVQGTVVLPDSTVVTLNSGSSLRLADDFNCSTRTVYLDGEGYFDVSHNKSKPFLIKTPQEILVTVTGTRFNVKCYCSDPKFDLTLLQGSVDVTTKANEVIHVHPSQQIVISNEFHSVENVARPDLSLAWKDGILRFDNTSMSEAIGRIERWYGVKVIVEDESVYRSSFTAEFRHETLSEVLKLLCITSRLEYTENDGVVILKKSSKQ